MIKERKHRTPLEWEEEDSGEVRHPHREAKIVDEKKIGQEPLGQELDDQEQETGTSKKEYK